jgi:DASH complex subunit Duo1
LLSVAGSAKKGAGKARRLKGQSATSDGRIDPPKAATRDDFDASRGTAHTLKIIVATITNKMTSHEEEFDFTIEGSDPDHLFDSPEAVPKAKTAKGSDVTPIEPSKGSKERETVSPYNTEETREAALSQELENVRKVNQVIEGVVESLEKAKNNMEVWRLQCPRYLQ